MECEGLQKLRRLNAPDALERGLCFASEPIRQQSSEEEREGRGLLLRCHLKQSASECEHPDVDKVSCDAPGAVEPLTGKSDISCLKEVMPHEAIDCDNRIDESQMKVKKGNVEVVVEESKECVNTDNTTVEPIVECKEVNGVSESCGSGELIATDTSAGAEVNNRRLSRETSEEISRTERGRDVIFEEPGSSESNGRQSSEANTEDQNFGGSSKIVNATNSTTGNDTLSSSIEGQHTGFSQSNKDLTSKANHGEVLSESHHESQEKNVAQDSNAVYASRDIRYYPCSHSRPVSKQQCQDGQQFSGSRSNRSKFKSFSRNGRRPSNEAKSYSETKTSEANQNCRLFVGNLSYKITGRDMYDYFSQFGPLQDCHIVKHHVTKKSKGFGFVTFQKESTAECALNSPPEKRTLDGRVMNLSQAVPKKQSWLAEAARGEQSVSTARTLATVVENKDCYIHLLPDEVLANFFKYLNVRERVLIERVCHRWCHVAKASWQSVKHISFHHTFSLWKGQHLTDKVFREILKRGCCELRSIDLSGCPRNLTDFALSLVAVKCKKLTHLDISGVSVSTNCLRKVSENCTKLQWIRLHKCFKVGEKALWWLFHCCNELQYVDVERNSRLTGQCFYVLGGQLSTAILSGCTKLSDKGIELLVSRSPNLTELDISSCVSLTDEGIKAVTSSCCKLKQLGCSSCGSSVTSYGLFHLSNLFSLEKLYLSQNSAVNDYVIGAIARHCSHLCELDLSSCRGGITDVGIQCLVGCIHLSFLDISYITGLTDEGVTQLAQVQSLKKLIARCCTGITTTGFVAVATLCELEELDVSSCYQLGDVFIEKVIAAKSTNTLLLIDIGGTSVTDGCIARMENSGATVKFNLHCLAHSHLIPDVCYRLGNADDGDDEETESLEEEQNDSTLISAEAVVSNVTAAGTFDDASISEDFEEELDDVGQYCADFLINDDPSMFPDNEDEWLLQS